MYAVIDSARNDKDLLRSQGLTSVLLPFIRQIDEADLKLISQRTLLANYSDRFEKKLRNLDIVLSLLSLFVLLLAVTEYEVFYHLNGLYKDPKNPERITSFSNEAKSLLTPMLRTLISCFVLVSSLLVYFRYSLIVKIAILNHRLASKATIWNTTHLKYFLVELGFQLVHCPAGCYGYIISYELDGNEPIPTNAIILVVMYARILYLWRLVCVISRYETQLSRTICEDQFVENRRIFFLKMKIKESIVVFYVAFSAVVIIVFGSIVVLSERTYTPTKRHLSISNYFDGFWVVFEILSTVGFGDLEVITNFGRIMIVGLVAFSIFSQYLTKIFHELVEMDSNQLKSFQLFQIEESKSECIKLAAKAVSTAIHLNTLLNNPGRKFSKFKLIRTYTDLVHYVEKFKFARKDLKTKTLECTTTLDLVRKFQYQVGKIADIRCSYTLKKAGKLFSMTTKLAKSHNIIMKDSQDIEKRSLFALKFLHDAAICSGLAGSNIQDTDLKFFTLRLEFKNQLPLMAELLLNIGSPRRNLKRITKMLPRTSILKKKYRTHHKRKEPSSGSQVDNISSGAIQSSLLMESNNSLDMDNHLNPDMIVEKPNSDKISLPQVIINKRIKNNLILNVEQAIPFIENNSITNKVIKSDEKTLLKRKTSTLDSNFNSPHIQNTPNSTPQDINEVIPKTLTFQGDEELMFQPNQASKTSLENAPVLMAITGRRFSGDENYIRSMTKIDDVLEKFSKSRSEGTQDANLQRVIEKYRAQKFHTEAFSSTGNGYIDEVESKIRDKKKIWTSELEWEEEYLNKIGKDEILSSDDEEDDSSEEDEPNGELATNQIVNLEKLSKAYQGFMQVIPETENDLDTSFVMHKPVSDLLVKKHEHPEPVAEENTTVVKENDSNTGASNYSERKINLKHKDLKRIYKEKRLKNLKDRAHAKLVKINESVKGDE